MRIMQAELVLDARAVLGEGPVWDFRRQRLWWVDIEGQELHVFDPLAGEDRAIPVGQPVSAVVMRAARSGGLMLAVKEGFAIFDVGTERLTLIARPEAELPGNRFNDGKCDPAGRFWAGTMGPEPRQGALYCLDTDLSVKRKIERVSISNGLAWSPDGGTMYYIDSTAHVIAAYEYDTATGEIANRRVVVEMPVEAGEPDGMTIDVEGMLWVALWDGGSVVRYRPADGAVLARVSVPVSRPTSCAFGGADLDTLFITSARTGLDERALSAEPHAGGLFCCRPGVRGMPAADFGG